MFHPLPDEKVGDGEGGEKRAKTGTAESPFPFIHPLLLLQTQTLACAPPTFFQLTNLWFCLLMFIPLGCLWTGLLLLEWLLWATSAFGLEELGDTVGLGVGLDLEISLVDTEGLAD